MSFYYCFAASDGELESIVAEITNTPWNQRHAYVLDVAAARVLGTRRPPGASISTSSSMSRPSCRWASSTAGGSASRAPSLAVFMENWQDGRKVFDAGMDLAASPLTSGSLARSLATLPGATLKILVQIYWQALRLLLKKTPFHQHPQG